MANVSSRIVEICVFTRVQQTPKYLLLQRSATESVYPGIWQIVTGSIEGNEHAVTAALRELHEETGFRPSRLWVTPFVDTFYSAMSDTTNLVPVFAAFVPESDEPKLSNEHQKFAWLGFEDAVKRLVWRGQKKALKVTRTYIVENMEGGSLAEINNISQFERRPA